MPLRIFAAYVLIVLVMAALGSTYLVLTRKHRAWNRTVRAYRRNRRGDGRPG